MTAAPRDVAADRRPAPCAVCGSSEREVFWQGRGMTLLECRGCRLVAPDPPPSDETVAALYHDTGQGATTGYFAKVDKKMRRSRLRVKKIRRYVPGGRFLDVGCNGGFMVEAAREAGFEAWGVEIDPVAVAYAREHYPENRYFLGRVEDFAATAPRFDAVYCSEVIEHVPDSNAFVAAVAKVMREGAVLYITTPDIGHWRVPRRIEDWDAFCPPSHCVFFRPANLVRLLANHGLRVFHKSIAFKPGIKFLARRV
ncbi:MAG: class I SAM-dependent methyltransferase [Alphaproteobacteria bacterium]